MKKIYIAFAILVLGILAFVWFSQKPDKSDNVGEKEVKESDTGYIAPSIMDYDSTDTAIVVKRSVLEKKLSFRNLDTGKQYTLNVTEASCLFNRDGGPLTLEQIMPGMVVDISFLKRGKTLTTLAETNSAFNIQNLTDFEVSDLGKSITINGSKYKISDMCVVASGLDVVTPMDIASSDILNVRGYDREVISIIIDKGHGYLRLSGDESFIGGWIEVGPSIIRQITENMILTVPEGVYDVSVSNEGSGGTRKIEINRGQETTLDVSDLVCEAVSGSVQFDVTPSDAKVYVDGKLIDASAPVTLTYGIHLVTFKADGYNKLSKYVKVGQEYATLPIVMEEEKVETPTPSPSVSVSPTPSPAGDISVTPDPGIGVTDSPVQTDNSVAVQNYFVNIEKPEGVEVYLDGAYVGLSPLKFPKVSGSHEIVLRSEGCQTRSFTVNIDEEKSDISYTFPELRELNE